MSNTYSIFEDWKKTLGSYYDQAETGLLGRKDIVAGKDMGTRSGGVLGGDGVYDRSIEYAGKKFDEVKNTTVDQVKDYALGEDKLVSSPSIGETVRPGFKGSQMDQDINKGLDKGIEYFDKGIKKSKSFIEDKIEEIFPEFATNNISENDKKKLIAGYESGNVDPNLVKALKEKTSPINQKDVGTLEKIIGIDFDTAKANWKDKGGFEGLMSNPAFTLGLALMQSSANGKTINQGILDNFIKSAKISTEFKDRIKANAGGVTEATAPQMDKIKDILEKSFDISGPILRRILPGNQPEKYEQAVEDIVFKVQAKVTSMKKKAEKSGKNIEVGSRLYKKIIKDMIDSGEISKKGGLSIGGVQIFDSTLEARAQGGPVEQGKPYVVGEKGPEIIIPRSDGNVLSNDDSQIYAMLLASNPQLQKVSRQRAEKILRNRFPEYFEG
jgi:hypothetical protein